MSCLKKDSVNAKGFLEEVIADCVIWNDSDILDNSMFTYGLQVYNE